jgi:hypothetical protein
MHKITSLLLMVAVLFAADNLEYTKWNAEKLLTDKTVGGLMCLYELNDRAMKGQDVDVIVKYMRDMTQPDYVRFRALQALENTGNEDMLVFALNLACFGNNIEKVQGYYSMLENGNKDWIKKTEMVMGYIDNDERSENGNLSYAAKWFRKRREEAIKKVDGIIP